MSNSPWLLCDIHQVRILSGTDRCSGVIIKWEFYQVLTDAPVLSGRTMGSSTIKSGCHDKPNQCCKTNILMS